MLQCSQSFGVTVLTSMASLWWTPERLLKYALEFSRLKAKTDGGEAPFPYMRDHVWLLLHGQEQAEGTGKSKRIILLFA